MDAIGALILALVAAGFTWFVGRRKGKAEGKREERNDAKKRDADRADDVRASAKRVRGGPIDYRD